MLNTAASCIARPLVRRALLWAGLSLALNLVWEVAQLPLYMIAQDPSATRIAYAVLHCTVGDAIIAAASLILAGFVSQDADWPSSRPWSGGAVAILFGLAYTAYSEWYNVYETGAWAYSARMPLVFGIGLAPLLQWLVVPVATLLIVRTWDRAKAQLGRAFGAVYARWCTRRMASDVEEHFRTAGQGR